MYSYPLIRSITHYIVILWCVASGSLNAMISPTPELAQAAKMISPAASKELQEKYQKAQKEVEATLKQLEKARQEHDTPGIIKASQASHAAQVTLDALRKQLNEQ